MHYLYRIEGTKDTSLSVHDRSWFFFFFFFNATPWHTAILLSFRDRSFFFLTPPRGTERHRSLGPRPIIHFFFNATPWLRAALLSRSATACVASVSVRLGAKNEERESNTSRKNGASKRAGRGHPVAQSDTALSDRDRCYLFFPWCHRVAQQRHSFSPRPKRYLVYSLL